MTQSAKFHQTEFNREASIGCRSDCGIELREQRDRPEQKFSITRGCLCAITVEQRSRNFEQGQRLSVTTHQQVAAVLRQTRHKCLRREPGRQYAVEEQQRTGVVARHQRLDRGEIGVVVEYVERASHLAIRERLTAERNRLIEHRQCVAHTSIGLLSDQVERLIVVGNALLLSDIFQIADTILDTNTVEVEDLAA